MKDHHGRAGVLLAIVGPTASGKTRMSVEVAVELGSLGHRVEIVSCDSMAVYRGLDIAADKPSEADRRGVPHHLLDIAEPSEDLTAVAYRALARRTIDEISSREAVPMLVGGSGLWFRAVVDDLDFAPTSSDVRKRLELEDPEVLHERLAKADPAAAASVDVRNRRRVVRAVEILELTGRPPSELRTAWSSREGPYDLCVAGLSWERDELYRRAAERVSAELDAGLLEEVRTVRDLGLSRTASQALGVKELVGVLDGDVSLDEATAILVRSTKRFARRQLQWFGADPRVAWVNASEAGWEGARAAIVERFRARLGQG